MATKYLKIYNATAKITFVSWGFHKVLPTNSCISFSVIFYTFLSSCGKVSIPNNFAWYRQVSWSIKRKSLHCQADKHACLSQPLANMLVSCKTFKEKHAILVCFIFLFIFTGSMNTLARRYFSKKYGFMSFEEQVMWKYYFSGLLNHQPVFWIITNKVMYSEWM